MTVRPATAIGSRIEGLLGELAARGVGEQAEELASLIVRMYGDGLSRLVELLDDDLLVKLAGDPVIGGLLILHDLHPVAVHDRVKAALDRVRPYLGSHAGGVEFLGIDDDGKARLRLQGSCNGCPASTVTVTTAIETAIMEAAPELAGIEVEGVVPTSQALLTIGPGRRQTGKGGTWEPLPEPAPGPGEIVGVTLNGARLILVSFAAEIYAFEATCPISGTELVGSSLDGELLTCRGCGTAFDLTRAGRSVDGSAMLAPVPLLQEDGVLRVAIPETVA